MISRSSIRREVVCALIILFVVSSIVPTVTIAHGAHNTDLSQSQSQMQAQLDGTIVAQQDKKGGSKNKKDKNKKGNNKKGKNKKVNTIIEWLKVLGVNYDDASKKEKQQIKNALRTLLTKDLSKKEEKKQLKKIIEPLDDSMLGSGLSGTRKELVKQTIANVFNEKIGGYAPVKSVPPSGDRKTIRALTKLAQEFEGVMVGTMPSERVPLKKHLRKLQTGSHTKDEMKMVLRYIINDLRKMSISLNKKEREKVEDILTSVYGKGKVADEQNKKFLGGIVDIGALIDAKLDALKEDLVKAFEHLFKEIYSHTLGTPVPENSGWHQIFGTPTNKPFKTLYQKLLVEKLYPVMNYLLGLGILFLGASFAVNPFMSRHRIWDLLTKFVAGMMFYAFGWTVVTLLHGTVRGITSFIVPNPEAVTRSAETLLVFGASVPIAAALAGALSGFSSLFAVGLVLGIRYFLLSIVLPYIFGPLMLIMYISPWQKVRKWASVILWQYINILTMVIPIAIVLKAAVAVQWAFGGAVGFIFTTIGALIFLFAYPLGSTYFFFKMSGSVVSSVRSGVSGASGRLKDRAGWGGDDTASDTSATGGKSTGSQAQEMVDAEKEQSGTVTSSTSSSSSSSSSQTTAQQVRNAYEDDDDPMSPDDMKEYIRQNENITTLKEELSQS